MGVDLDDLHERLMRLVDRETMDMCESVFAELKTLRHEMFNGEFFGLPLAKHEMKTLSRLLASVSEELLRLARK